MRSSWVGTAVRPGANANAAAADDDDDDDDDDENVLT